MSWALVIVIIACLATLVALVAVVMPYVRVRPQDEVKAAALADLNKRLTLIESELMDVGARRAMPAMPGRRG